MVSPAEGPHRGIITHFMYRLLSFLGVPDHKVYIPIPLLSPSLSDHPQGGIVVLLAAVCLSIVQRNAGRKLSVDIGGLKRLQALSTTLSAALLLPWVSLQLATQSTSLPSLPSLGPLLLLGVAQLVDFYAATIATQRVDQVQVGRLSAVLSFSSALAMATFSWHWYHDNQARSTGDGEEHGLSVGVVMATVFFLVATATLTRPNPRSSSYSLVGYSSAGLPLYSSHRSSLQFSLLSLAREGLRKIMDDGNSRRIFYFLLLNLVGVASLPRGRGLRVCLCSVPGVHGGGDAVWSVDQQPGPHLRRIPHALRLLRSTGGALRRSHGPLETHQVGVVGGRGLTHTHTPISLSLSKALLVWLRTCRGAEWLRQLPLPGCHSDGRHE